MAVLFEHCQVQEHNAHVSLTQPRVKQAPKRNYHHGDLQVSLVTEAKRLVAQRGVENISLRQVATNIGVSPSAAYHHFGDKDELLRAAAISAFDDLALFQELALAKVPGNSASAIRERFRILGSAYVGFARKNPNLFRLAFGPYCGGEELAKEESKPWQMLVAALDAIDSIGDIDPTLRPHSEILVWAAIHGAANLIIDKLLPAEALDPILDSVANSLKGSLKSSPKGSLKSPSRAGTKKRAKL